MRIVRATGLLIVAAFLVPSTGSAAATRIKKAELPEAVREAVDREVPGGHIVACWRNVADRAAVYEVDLKVAGHKKGLVVSVDGEVLVEQQEVTWDSLPDDVRRSFQRAASGSDIEEVHELTHEGEVVGYVARIDGDDKVKDFQYEVGPHGEPLGHHATGRLTDAWRERTPKPTP